MDYIKILAELANAFLHIYIAYIFFSTFWEIKVNKIYAVVTVSLCSIILAVSLCYLKGTLLFYLHLVLTMLLTTLLFDSKIINKILCILMYLAITAVVETLVGVSISAAFGINLSAVNNYSAFHISGILISKLAAFLIILLIRFKKINTLLPQYRFEYISIFLIPFSTLLISILQCKLFFEHPNQSTSNKITIIISYTALIVSNIIVFNFINSLYTNTVNESKIHAANDIISAQTMQYQALIDNNKKIMQIQHDHKNFCIGLLSELQSGNIENATKRLQKEYDICTSEKLTGGDIVTTLINIKQNDASQHNTEIIHSGDSLENIRILPTDMAILLGNALDNAIEAVSRFPEDLKKIIEVFTTIKNNKIYISITNPIKEQIDTANLLSGKKDNPEQHGYGIISMKQIAEKYHGEVLFSCEDGKFCAMIVMQND